MKSSILIVLKITIVCIAVLDGDTENSLDADKRK